MKKSLRETLKTQTVAEKNRDARAALSADELIKEYSGMSEKELMRELKEVTGRQKAEGVFDADSVKRGMDALAPFLTPEQQKKLNEIVSEL